ncbi:hypothetical protein VTI74DRAFT_4171 [Chaetomium olivicolor]
MATSPSQKGLASPPTTASKPPTFVDLPREVQEEIIKHCSTRDLICVALVSRHFRDLAAAELYRDFQIVFPDEDNPQFDTPVDSLAGGFDTFVTSDYDYARYLRALSFDTLYLGDKAELAYRPYLANLSCGKFMNTLLLLTLRKAKALESFRWNIRVELSRPVYKELHRLRSLSHVQIRLQAGPSQYETPPPLPYNSSHSTSSPVPAHATPVTSLPPPPPPPAFGLIPPPPSGFYAPTSTSPPLPKPPRPRGIKKAPNSKEPPTLSGFKNLKSLAVLEIDSLDIVPEIQECVRNCAGTLSKLKLSFSEKLALAARKPSADPEPEDSDQEDEMIPLPVGSSHGLNDELSGPARAFRAQEERKTQESVLGRILDVESYPPMKPLEPVTVKVEKKNKADSDQELVDFMKTLATRFMGELNGTTDVAASQDVLDMIGSAAQKYIEETKSSKQKQEEASNTSEASSSSSGRPSADNAEATAQPPDPAVSLFGKASTPAKAKEDKRETNPDDIDIEEPEEQLAIEPEEPVNDVPVSESTTTASEAGTTLADTEPGDEDALAESKAMYEAMSSELEMLEKAVKALGNDIQRARGNNSSVDLMTLDEAESRMVVLVRSIQEMQAKIRTHQAEIDDAAKTQTTEADVRRRTSDMHEYLRKTRGIALQSLSIYLIPVKASVLSRAVDLRALRRLTLLNVGVQAPIWLVLHRENREAPLPLREIFTDNVSLPFLNFVASLEEVHELFMLERGPKSKPESFAPKTQTTIDHIRRLVLKKHLSSLRRLLIKNLADTTWDVNEKVILLLCRQGKKLEELACNMSIRAMHCLMQNIAGLVALRALHIVHLRNDDTCLWVMRETKRFLIDNISHYPHLKLEWISIDEDDLVDRLVRRVQEKPTVQAPEGAGESGKAKDDKAKGKGKQKTSTTGLGSADYTAGSQLAGLSLTGSLFSNANIDAVVAAELGGGGGGGADATDTDTTAGETTEDEEDGDAFWGQKIETVDGISFCDVDGVRIFEKEVFAGRL